MKVFDRTGYFAKLQTQDDINKAERDAKAEVLAKTAQKEDLPGKTIRDYVEQGNTLLITFTDGTLIQIQAEMDEYDNYSYLSIGPPNLETALRYNLTDGSALAIAKQAQRELQDKMARTARAQQLIDGLFELEKVFGAAKVKEILDNNAE